MTFYFKNTPLSISGSNEEVLSPYDYAVSGGFKGTEAEFKEALSTGPWLPLVGGKIQTPTTSSDMTINDTGISLYVSNGAEGKMPVSNVALSKGEVTLQIMDENSSRVNISSTGILIEIPLGAEFRVNDFIYPLSQDNLGDFSSHFNHINDEIEMLNNNIGELNTQLNDKVDAVYVEGVVAEAIGNAMAAAY